MNKLRVVLCHPDPIVLNCYYHLLDAHPAFDLISMHARFDDACNHLHAAKADFLFAAHPEMIHHSLQEMCEYLICHSPKTKLIILGYKDQGDDLSCLRRPVRGVLDFNLQSPVQLRKALHHIVQHGSDFTVIINARPSLYAHIEHYRSTIPKVDDRFWELLPLLATDLTQAEMAQYFQASRKTLHQWVRKYCDQLEVATTSELMILATGLYWLDRKMVKDAREKVLQSLGQRRSA